MRTQVWLCRPVAASCGRSDSVLAAAKSRPGGKRHFTAEQLHGEAVEAAVRASLATVYNTLHQFIAAGLLREVVVNSGRSYFDTNVRDHHHFFFEDTGRLLDIPGEHIAVSGLPKPPAGAVIRRIDVIIRVDRDPAPAAD